MSNARGQSKNERRDAAREKAREQRLRQQRREKRNRAFLQLGIGVVIVAIVAVVAVVLVTSFRPAGPGPRNMANGGITISGAQLTAVRTGAAPAGSTPSPHPTTSGKVLIQAWEDFGCPNCKAFETQYASQIQQLVTSGAADVQYFPVAFLDRNFTDRNYSTRAANAAAAVANYSPDAFARFHALLYRDQPEEGKAGLTDDRLIAIAREAKATDMSAITTAIRGQRFKNWVAARTDDFLKDAGALKGVDFSKRLDPTTGQPSGPGTPTILVNGQYFDQRTSFSSFVTSVGGAYTPGATPTPSTSPSAKDTPPAG